MRIEHFNPWFVVVVVTAKDILTSACFHLGSLELAYLVPSYSASSPSYFASELASVPFAKRFHLMSSSKPLLTASRPSAVAFVEDSSVAFVEDSSVAFAAVLGCQLDV